MAAASADLLLAPRQGDLPEPSAQTVKILVAIAHHGMKNRQHLQRLIHAYRSMPFEVHIVVLTEEAKGLGPEVTEQVGLPTPDPWSLPFAHRRLFVDNVANYDLFIYSEDDTLILESHVRAFLQAVRVLPPDRLPGFIRYELHPDGRKNFTSQTFMAPSLGSGLGHPVRVINVFALERAFGLLHADAAKSRPRLLPAVMRWHLTADATIYCAPRPRTHTRNAVSAKRFASRISPISSCITYQMLT